MAKPQILDKPQLFEESKSHNILAAFKFLLSCSETSLYNFELKKLSEANNLRSKLHEDLDGWFDAALQADLARLFRVQGRERIQQVIEQPFDAIADAKAKLNPPEVLPEGYVPPEPLPEGQAHRTASLSYQKRNVAEGKCCVCPTPLARNSVLYCEKHLAACRERARVRARKRREKPSTTAALATVR